ncbi:MAG: MarR family transcriptional regulator [Acidimicrobiales bacterium]|nr:MarR family transcriptional regulator [Acidimicrobiales bacterium]
MSGSSASHELDAPPWLRVESTLISAARDIRAAYDLDLAPLDLTLNSASTLAYVAEHGPLTQTDLAERLGLGRAATGTHVDRLEARKLLVRQADAEDRRVWLVAATESGRNLHAQIQAIDAELRAQLRAGIDRRERQMLADVLVRLRKNLQARSAEALHPQP